MTKDTMNDYKTMQEIPDGSWVYTKDGEVYQKMGTASDDDPYFTDGCGNEWGAWWVLQYEVVDIRLADPSKPRD